MGEGTQSLGYPDFAKVVRTMTLRRATGASGTGASVEVPDNRIRALWQDVDADGSGRVELEEFLIWFYTTFHGGSPEQVLPSKHSHRQAETVTERFYASLGCNRLRAAAAQAAKASPSKSDDSSSLEE